MPTDPASISCAEIAKRSQDCQENRCCCDVDSAASETRPTDLHEGMFAGDLSGTSQ